MGLFNNPYPLGLPKGSVRATITLLLSLDLVLLTIQDSLIADKVTTMTVVALTFYFGGKLRNTAPTPRTTDASLRAWGLPAGSIRTILIAIFAIASAYLQFIEGGIPNYFFEVINIILGYMVGKGFISITNKFKKEEEKEKKSGAGIVGHLKAIIILGMTIYTIFLTFTDPTSQISELIILVTSIVLGFYFGARD